MRRWEITVETDIYDTSEWDICRDFAMTLIKQTQEWESEKFPEAAMVEALLSPVRWDNNPVDEANPAAGCYTVLIPPSRIRQVIVREILPPAEIPETP